MTDAHTTTIDAFEMRCALHHGIGQDDYGDFHRRGQYRNGQNARHRLNVAALKAKLARLQTWAPRPAVGFNLRWRGAFEHDHLEAQDNATPYPRPQHSSAVKKRVFGFISWPVTITPVA
jgi:hypothetical protein